MHTSRVGVARRADAYRRPAGTIASRNGSATAAPAPRKKLRRGRCFPVMKFIPPPGSSSARSATAAVFGLFHRDRCLLHPERVALHDLEDEGRHPVVVLLGPFRDRTDERLIRV